MKIWYYVMLHAIGPQGQRAPLALPESSIPFSAIHKFKFYLFTGFGRLIACRVGKEGCSSPVTVAGMGVGLAGGLTACDGLVLGRDAAHRCSHGHTSCARGSGQGSPVGEENWTAHRSPRERGQI